MSATAYFGEPYYAQMFADLNALASGDPYCVTVEPPSMGVLGAIVTIESVNGAGPILIQAFEQCDSGGEPLASDQPVLQIELSAIPPNSVIVVDSAKHKVTLTQTDSSLGETTVEDGRHLLVLNSRSIQWIEIADCDAIECVCVRSKFPVLAGDTILVDIELQRREG